MDISAAKRAIRAQVRVSRSARTPEVRHGLTAGLEDTLATVIGGIGPSCIAAFLPLDSEPPIAPALERVLAAGVRVIVPVSHGEGAMTWHDLTTEALHNPGADAEGMPVPRVLTTATQHPDLILIPAAAADTRGNRLGWGKGYYDRYLATVDPGTPVIAVVFDDEVRADIPVESHDRGTTHVVTPTRVITV